MKNLIGIHVFKISRFRAKLTERRFPGDVKELCISRRRYGSGSGLGQLGFSRWFGGIGLNLLFNSLHHVHRVWVLNYRLVNYSKYFQEETPRWLLSDLVFQYFIRSSHVAEEFSVSLLFCARALQAIRYAKSIAIASADVRRAIKGEELDLIIDRGVIYRKSYHLIRLQAVSLAMMRLVVSIFCLSMTLIDLGEILQKRGSWRKIAREHIGLHTYEGILSARSLLKQLKPHQDHLRYLCSYLGFEVDLYARMGSLYTRINYIDAKTRPLRSALGRIESLFRSLFI